MYGQGAVASSRESCQRQRQKEGEWLSGLLFLFSEQFDSATMRMHLTTVSIILIYVRPSKYYTHSPLELKSVSPLSISSERPKCEESALSQEQHFMWNLNWLLKLPNFSVWNIWPLGFSQRPCTLFSRNLCFALSRTLRSTWGMQVSSLVKHRMAWAKSHEHNPLYIFQASSSFAIHIPLHSYGVFFHILQHWFWKVKGEARH